MWLVSALIGVVVAIALHAATSRLVAANAVLRFVLAGSLTGLFLIAWLFRKYGCSIESVAGVLIYALACETYIFVFTLAGFSISANLLGRLRGGAMSEGEIDRLYDSAQMIRLRLARSTEKKLIAVDDGIIVLTPSGRRLVVAFTMLRRFFGHQL